MSLYTAEVDAKLIRLYEITAQKWRRAWRKKQGLANLQYIRHRRFFVLLATDGEHLFFQAEQKNLRDARRVAIRYGGYQIGYRGGHVQVRIDDATYRMLKAYYVDLALRRSRETLIDEFYRFPFEPYAVIRKQTFSILREVNRARKRAGFAPVPTSAVWLKRRVVKPFETAPQPGERLVGS